MRFVRYYTFSVVCFLYMLNPKNYNPATKEMIIKQIYYTAIEILPVFILSAVVFGAAINGMVVYLAIQYGLKDFIGFLIVKFIIVELIPFLLALAVSFRTGLRVGIKTAIMKVNGEINTLKMYDIDTVRYLFMPRAFGNTIGFVSLVFLFSVIMMISGYVFLFLMTGMELDMFLNTIISAVSVKDIVIFIVKSFIFGFIIVTIPSYDGLMIKKRYFEIPVTISKTISALFVAILFLEVVSLTIELI